MRAALVLGLPLLPAARVSVPGADRALVSTGDWAGLALGWLPVDEDRSRDAWLKTAVRVLERLAVLVGRTD